MDEQPSVMTDFLKIYAVYEIYAKLDKQVMNLDKTKYHVWA